LLQFIIFKLRHGREVGRSTNLKARSVSAVWSMMGLAATLYSFTAIFSHDTWQVSYFAAILMLVGLVRRDLVGRWCGNLLSPA
jgi:hypothetical protein